MSLAPITATRREPVPPVLFAARIETTAAAIGATLLVTIPGFDGGRHSFGPCPWTPRPGAAGALVLPVKGDRALVARADDGEWWVLAWEPA